MRRFAAWSNAFYLAPCLLAVSFQLWVPAVSVGMLFIASLAFHMSGERRFVRVDKVVSLVVALLFLYLIFTTHFAIQHLAVLIPLVCAAFVVRYGIEEGNAQDVAHGVWHLLVATTLTLCVAIIR